MKEWEPKKIYVNGRMNHSGGWRVEKKVKGGCDEGGKGVGDRFRVCVGVWGVGSGEVGVGSVTE